MEHSKAMEYESRKASSEVLKPRTINYITIRRWYKSITLHLGAPACDDKV